MCSCQICYQHICRLLFSRVFCICLGGVNVFARVRGWGRRVFAQRKDLLFTGLNQIWRVIAEPLLLLLIPFYLSPAEQGFWYTFISIAALSVFADFGGATIVLQFAAHEFSRLEFLADGRVAGDEQALWRLASFFRFSLVWLLRVVAVVFPLILAGDYYFLSLREVDFAWQMPWFYCNRL